MDYDRKSDGMYPLLSNDRKLPARDVLVAHKGQPAIEKRFQQCKSVYEIAPVLLKNEGRVEARPRDFHRPTAPWRGEANPGTAAPVGPTAERAS